MDKKIMVQIPLTKYLRELTRMWGSPDKIFITKTKGGQVWISNEAPGDIEGEDTYYDSPWTGKEEYIGKNEIDFSDSDIFMRLPKEIHKHFQIKYGSYKTLKEILADIKKKEFTQS
jgi:hypothetical protein